MNNLIGAFQDYIMFIVLGVFFVLMLVMTIIPQRKQKKKQAEMMSSLGVGDKIMTIGGMIGTIEEVDGDNYVVNVGTIDNPSKIVFIKNAIRSKL